MDRFSVLNRMMSFFKCNNRRESIPNAIYLLLLLLGIIAAPAAGLCRSGQAAASRPRILFLVPAENTAEAKPLVRSIQAQLADLEVDFSPYEIAALPPDFEEQVQTARKVARDADALAVMWFDFRSTEHFNIFNPTPRSQTLLVRFIEDAEADNPTEAIAIIARASITEILRGKSVGQDPSEAIASMKQQTGVPVESRAAAQARSGRPPSATGPHRVGISTGYSLHFFSSEILLIHGLDLRLELRLTRSWAVGAGYILANPLTLQTDGISVEILRYPVFAWVHFATDLIWVRVGARVAMTLDYLRYEVTGVDLEPVDDLDDISWGLLAGLDLAFPINEWFGAIIIADALIPLNLYSYEVEQGTPGQTRTLFGPWTVQPRVTAGLYMEFF